MMPNQVDIKWKRGCFYELRRLPGVQTELMRLGRRMQDDANATLKEKRGYGISSKQGRKKPQGRWRVTVYTSSNHAKRSNAIHNTLVRVLG